MDPTAYSPVERSVMATPTLQGSPSWFDTTQKHFITRQPASHRATGYTRAAKKKKSLTNHECCKKQRGRVGVGIATLYCKKLELQIPTH